MGAITRIAWRDATFNPWVGCLLRLDRVRLLLCGGAFMAIGRLAPRPVLMAR
jgi:hypothetical protein